MVTGAGSGIGLALSRRLGLAGARVLMADLAEDRLGQAVSGLREIGLEVEGVTMDVSDAGSLECLAEQAFSAGPVAVICLNAGVPGPLGEPTWGLDLAEWEPVIRVNMWAPIAGSNVFVRRLVEQAAPSHLFFTISQAGLWTSPASAPYFTTKHAVYALATILRDQLATSPVRVSAICRAPCRPPSWSRSANSTGRRRRMGPCPRTAASTPSAGRSPPRSSPRRWRTPSAPRDSTCSPTPSTAASTRSTSARCSTSGRRRSPSARCWYRSTGCWRRSSPQQPATSPPASARTPGKATPSPPDWLACHSPSCRLRSAVCARRRNRGARRRPRRGALAGNRAGFGRGGRNRCRRFHRGFGRHMDGGVDQPARGGDALRRAR